MGQAPKGFAYTVADNGTVRITRYGKDVTVLRSAAATRFRSDVERGDAQQVMAQVTGNYRRGNERRARDHPRNRRR